MLLPDPISGRSRKTVRPINVHIMCTYSTEPSINGISWLQGTPGAPAGYPRDPLYNSCEFHRGNLVLAGQSTRETAHYLLGVVRTHPGRKTLPTSSVVLFSWSVDQGDSTLPIRWCANSPWKKDLFTGSKGVNGILGNTFCP